MEMEAIKTLLTKDPDTSAFARALAVSEHRGIEESKLAHTLGYDEILPPKFVDIARMLQVECRRLDVGGKNPLKFWPTPELLCAVAELQTPWHQKLVIKLKEPAGKIIVGIITVVLTALFLAFFGLG
ncbi:MAG: hypothetical protein ACE5JQ_00815 [Candidatus Methylomirabilales bacterium]